MQKVRLTDEYLNTITKLFREIFGKDDHLWLFGSRVDLSKRGGDIDLYIETCEIDKSSAWKKESRFWVELQKALGEQKIDIVTKIIARDFTISIYDEAKATGVMLT